MAGRFAGRGSFDEFDGLRSGALGCGVSLVRGLRGYGTAISPPVATFGFSTQTSAGSFGVLQSHADQRLLPKHASSDSYVETNLTNLFAESNPFLTFRGHHSCALQPQRIQNPSCCATCATCESGEHRMICAFCVVNFGSFRSVMLSGGALSVGDSFALFQGKPKEH